MNIFNYLLELFRRLNQKLLFGYTGPEIEFLADNIYKVGSTLPYPTCPEEVTTVLSIIHEQRNSYYLVDRIIDKIQNKHFLLNIIVHIPLPNRGIYRQS